ncbi:MAG: amidohydrolase [Candidatus Thermoplasmatota archaeon]|jgi:5-methylthioadenosine/S-adenosylhomocysteine deaminase|nr:amidohydrolase [Candidatus Thermoplasmatota archaeon]
MSILIKNTSIITQNKKKQKIMGDLYIEDKEITQISKKNINVEADYKIDGRNKLVLPGLINTHTHIPMTLLRGYGDDMILSRWLKERIWPIEAKLNPRSIEIGTRLGLLEMISSGTTTYLDMYFFEDTIGKTTEETGLRGFLGFPMLDLGTPEFSSDQFFPECEKFIKRWRNNDLIKPVIAPHATYTCGPENLEKIRDLSDKYDVLIHTHCAETREEVYDLQKKYGVRPVEQLKKHGLLCENMVLAHCGWITKNEIIDIKNGGSKVSHCPVSNMKIATGGFAPIPELIQSDVVVGLGTDGAASNNVLDMFDTMKFCALMHKQHRWDPGVLPAQTVFDFATIGGARCLKMEKNIGSIEVGKKADIIIIDLNKPHLTPKHDLVSHLVYAMRGNDVSTTIVNGKPLMLDKEFLTIDYEKTIEDAERCAKELTS